MKNFERINTRNIDEASEDVSKELRFLEDPDQYSEEELMADPAKRFRVNPADFPIFTRQAELGPRWGDKAETLPLDETVGRFVQSTADTIAVLAGEDEGMFNIFGESKEKIPAADHVIYLDKSARPVSWFVSTFWSAFSEKNKPKHSYLAIDRKEWFARTGVSLGFNEYITDPDGSERLAKFGDIRLENITREDIARIRALYIPGGIESEDVDEIMSTPTGLNGKNITIIDEVSRSNSTINIAKYLVSRAIPEAASVNGYIFWNPGFQIPPSGSGLEPQMRGAPVWYNKNTYVGRGIGDINESFFEQRYRDYPNAKTRAQKFGAIVLGEFINLTEEPGNMSRELAKEIVRMRKEWDNGHILMPAPKHFSMDKWQDDIISKGMQFVAQDKAEKRKPLPKNAYVRVLDTINGRPPAFYI